MTTYTATFSTGKTITRTSYHPYRFAVALVNKTTGRIINVKFTAAENERLVKADWNGFEMRRAGGGRSQRDADRINARTQAERDNWQVEIVPASA